MLNNLILAMSETLLILFALTYIFKQGMYHLENYPLIGKNIVIGVIFGLFGVANILMGITLAPGVIVDLRSPLVLVAGIFSGGFGAFVSAGIIAVYRVIVVGGVGSLGGMLSIFGVAFLATYWHYKMPHPTKIIWALLGLLSVGISTFIGYATLPEDIRILFLSAFVPTAILFYPLLTVLLGSLIDNTIQEYELRHQLAISQQRFRAIFDQTFQFAGLLKPDGTLIEANQTALQFAGLQPEDVIQKPFWEAKWWSLSEETQTELQVAIKRASQGEFVRYNVDVLGNDNQIITIDFSLKPIFGADGIVNLIIPEGRDVTAELLAQKQKVDLQLERERNLSLNQFIIDSSHHMRTPITIIGTSHYLMSKYAKKMNALVSQLSELDNATPDADSQRQLLLQNLQAIIDTCEKRTDHIETAMKRFNTLLDNLTELASLYIERNNDFNSTDLVPVLRVAFEDYQPLANEKNLQFTLNVEDNLPTAEVNPQQIRSMLKKVIENAIRYTPSGGRIALTGNFDDGNIIISVEDSGIGIPTNERDAIFERFYRTENAQTHTNDGSGLGLTIVKQIVEDHNGKIEVASDDGKGTTVTIILPCSQASVVKQFPTGKNVLTNAK